LPHPDRPQSPGYLANMMARLFHEVLGDSSVALGVAPATFPLLIELWFADGPVTRQSLRVKQESGAEVIDPLVRSLAAAGLIVEFPPDPAAALKLTERGNAVRDPVIAAARRTNAAALAVLSEAEAAAFTETMNRVINALQAARST
jgi:DNA-binding MarR family transcriptional regulator